LLRAVAGSASTLLFGGVLVDGPGASAKVLEDPELLIVTRVVEALELEELVPLDTPELVLDREELVDVPVVVDVSGVFVDALIPFVTIIKLSMKKVFSSLRFVMVRVCWPLRTIGDV